MINVVMASFIIEYIFNNKYSQFVITQGSFNNWIDFTDTASYIILQLTTVLFHDVIISTDI